jgi:tRNA modification GTPase
LNDDDRVLLSAVAESGRIVVISKSDLPAAWSDDEYSREAVRVSATTGAGLDALRQRIAESLGLRETYRDTPAITNIRHIDLLGRARVALDRARQTASSGMPEELVSADLAEARSALEEITGRRTADDTLNAIFSRFCIGK